MHLLFQEKLWVVKGKFWLMNNVDLLLLAQQRINKLKEYGLDSESIEEFKSKIKIVSEEERETLGKELFELITSKSFKDETDYEKIIEQN